MSFSTALRAATPGDPTCETCPEGADLSITVFFPGVGNGLDESGRIDYVNPDLPDPATGEQGRNTKEALLEELAGRIEQEQIPREDGKCCVRLLYEVDYDPARSARGNARSAVKAIEDLIEVSLGNEWVCEVHVHLLGFSAGGIVAVNVAEEFDACSLERAEPAIWCDREMPSEVPVELDVVTMATPFRLDFLGTGWIDPPFLSWLAEGVTWLGRKMGLASFSRLFGFHEFGWSLAENDYGGEPAECVCGMVSLVSSEDPETGPGDEHAGDRDPSEDVRLEAWEPKVIDLAAEGVTDHTHDLVPLEAMKRDGLRELLMPGCQCAGGGS